MKRKISAPPTSKKASVPAVPTSPNAKYYAEFLRRLTYQSKYIGLCNLCDDFLDEIFNSLKIIVNKQRLLLVGSEDASAGLDPILEEIDDEQCEQNKLGVGAKVLKIQEKLGQVEDNGEAILDKFNNKLKQSNEYLIKISTENHSLRVLAKDIGEKMKNIQINSSKRSSSQKDNEGYTELLDKFGSMQNHFSELETNLKLLTVPSANQLEMDKIRKLLSESTRTNLDLDTKLCRAEKTIRDKGLVIENLTKQLLEIEQKASLLTKERDTIQSQKNSAEARLKVVQGNLKSNEKVKDKIGSILLEKDQYITKLEVENKSMESELIQERNISARKLEEINGTLKDLTKSLKLKDNEILNLRELSTQTQAENQQLMKTLVEKEKDVGVAIMKFKEADRVYNGLLSEFDRKLKQKTDEKFAQVMTFLDEKQNEIDRLRTLLDEKKVRIRIYF